MTITGTSGDDILSGTGVNDTFDLTQGGHDRASGLGGNDIFLMGGHLDAGDRIDGGKGYDTLTIGGDYSAGLIFGPTTMVNIDNLVLAAGHSYSLTTDDATIAAGKSLTVDASALHAGDALTFNGSAETDGAVHVVGGAGNDNITGGAGFNTIDLSRGGNDTVNEDDGSDTILMGGALTVFDSIVGGAAGNNKLVLDGDYSAGLVLSSGPGVQNIQSMILQPGHSYDLTISRVTTEVSTFTVDASALGAGNFLRFDSTAEHPLAHVIVLGGAGNDVIYTGDGNDVITPGGGTDFVSAGAGDDVIDMGANLQAADRINGGEGMNTLLLDGDYTGTHAVTFTPVTLANVRTVQLAAGHSYDLTFASETFVSALDASALGAGSDLRATVGNGCAVHAGAGDDVLTDIGGYGPYDFFDLTKGGIDTVYGDGATTANIGDTLTADDSLRNMNILDVSGDYGGSHAVIFGPSTLVDVFNLELGAGHNYDFTENDGNVSAGFRMYVFASVDASNHVKFDGSAETDGKYYFVDSPANNVLFGGALDDIFDMGSGSDTVRGGGGDDVVTLFDLSSLASDTIDGGSGHDTLILATGGSTVTLNAGIRNVEMLRLTGTASFDLLTVDSNVAGGQTMTVDASALGAGISAAFDGSAETNGAFHLLGSGSGESLRGGSGNDVLQGGGGSDLLLGNGGSDTFVYNGSHDSTSSQFDRTDFDPSKDHFDLDVTVSGVVPEITAGTLRLAFFDSDLSAALNAGKLPAGDAVVFTPNSGDFSGLHFLIVDANGQAGYQPGLDYVIEIPGNAVALGAFI